jgi:uncharacterized membrane protein
MAFCPNCGAQATGTFCPNCGTALAGGSAGSTGGAAYSAPPPPAASTSGLTHNVAGMLCYFPFFIGLICSIVFLVVAPYNQNKTVRFNAFQSLFLHLGLFVFWMVLHLIVGMFAFVTHGLGYFLIMLYPILWLCILVLFIVLMYKAYNNQTVKLPFIGDLAQKQA